ncbi:PTS sugar transporter subunit IIA [Nocardioides aestuarii]|uniref:Ascorbate-specific PTS system EIIA component n=1 Tax=Nocardioides aestuarii TaxID=252231 RepID=A0ABW4TLZ7_9ACTN
MGTLGELVHDDAVALDVTVDGWEDAVRHAGRLLERVEVAGAAYTQSMIDSVHEKGPYIVIAPGFAFAHARPSEAVLRTGMSWVRLAEPVEFGHDRNDPVTLVVALAAKDADAHQAAMAELATVIADPERKAALDAAATPDEVLELLRGGGDEAAPEPQPERARQRRRGSTRNHILTVCGNGVGTSLFLKNTLEKVLDQWGWGPYITVEATDTVSARGKAKEADLIMTSAEIGRALGDLGVPMRIIDDFTSTKEIDAALRASYDV